MSKARSRARRASRFTLTTTATVVLLTAACVLAVLIAARFDLRLDTTATGEHSLAPRTRSILDALDAPIQLVASANFQALDPRIARRTEDLLAAFADASPRVAITRIDTGRPGAVPAYHQLVAEIAARESEDVEEATRALEDGLDHAKAVADTLPALAEQCARVADTLEDPAAAEWRNARQILNDLGLELESAVDEALPFLSSTFGPTTLPQPDAALQTIASASDKVTRSLAALESHARAPAPGLPEQAAAEMARAGDIAARLLQGTASAIDRLRQAPTLDALNVARLLREREAILAVGPTRTTAIPFDALLPASGGEGGAALLFAGEIPVANAIAAVTDDAQPAVVLVHAEPENLLIDRAQAAPKFRASVGQLIRRLRQRQINVAEWPTALDTPMPTRASLGLDPEAPLVWLVLGAPLASADDGYARVTKIADATRRLLDNGESVLLTVNPSDLPSVGEPNPAVAPLAGFGIDADSGRVLVTRTSTPRGPSFAAEHTLRQADAAHPIGAAMDALTIYLPAAVPISPVEPAPERTVVWPLLTIPDDEDTWAEARWQSPPPDPDPKRDDLTGPWHVAVAAERTRPDTLPASLPGGTQRLVVVGATQWYIDRITGARIEVEGRVAARFPGNRELLDASIAWLAGRDELIARSPEAQEIPRIGSLTGAQLTAIRWLLIAGLPALVLATGALTRLLRR